MKKVLLILSIVFTILTFIGAICVLTDNKSTNAGYAVIPMIIALVFLAAYRAYSNK